MSEFAKLPAESKSPVEIDTLILRSNFRVSSFLNSENFSAARALKGLR